MKKRAIVASLQATQQQVTALRLALNEAKAILDTVGLTELASKVGWLHERLDLLFARYEAMRGDITLDAAAAKRLTFAVGQFSARLDRLEGTTPPTRRPRKRPQKPAGPNGGPGRDG